MANNYVFTNKKGEVFIRKSGAWTYILKHYIQEKVGFESVNFKLKSGDWDKIADVSNDKISNVAEIDMFNALCTKSRLRVTKVYYGYKHLFNDAKYPISYINSALSETTNSSAVDKVIDDDEVSYILFITNNGRSYKYYKTDAELLDENKTQADSIRELVLRSLNKYVNDNLGYSRGLTIEKNTWDIVTRGADKDSTPTLQTYDDILTTFNALCKRSKDCIVLAAAFKGGKGNGPIFFDDSDPSVTEAT